MIDMTQNGEYGQSKLAECALLDSLQFKTQIVNFILTHCDLCRLTKNWNSPNFDMIHVMLEFMETLKLKPKLIEIKSSKKKKMKGVKLYLFKFVHGDQRLNIHVKLKVKSRLINLIKEVDACSNSQCHVMCWIFKLTWDELCKRLTSYDTYSSTDANYNVYLLKKMLQTIKFTLATTGKRDEFKYRLCCHCCESLYGDDS